MGVIVALVLIGGGIVYFTSQNGTDLSSDATEDNIGENERNNEIDSSVTAAPKTHAIQMSGSGFSPSPLEINAGDTVTFTNAGNADMWPASAMHPTHTIYPGSDIDKCGTSEENNIFDACKGIKSGESWSFTFNEKGSWNYHDHLNSALFGKIAVK